MKTIPLVMKVWAGAEPHDMDYIRRSIPSLLKSRLPDDLEIVIYDDCSPNSSLWQYLREIANKDSRIRLLRGVENKGPNLGQQDLYKQIVEDYPAAPYYINVDDDVVYHRDWLRQLLAARKECRSLGLNGIFTALNMPFREPHSVLTTRTRKYLLKWKQPALNWLIPREIYETVGPFHDEGIAYDTVYSHWMRLKNLSVICLTPSYVQNIGLLGAYATDDTTTSLDFVGEGDNAFNLRQRVHALRYRLRRLPDAVRGLISDSARQIAPVRWGTEFVHEGVTRSGDSVALFSFEDAVRLGWDTSVAAERVQAVQRADPNGSAGILGLDRNRKGVPIRAVCRWEFCPNLRELATLGLAQSQPGPEVIFRALLEQLYTLHENGVVHNKVRRDNVYWADEGKPLRLAWLGTEPCPGMNFLEQKQTRTIDLLSGALSRWPLASTREEFAARYLESLAPEVLRGEPATPQSDLFSTAAVVALTLGGPIITIEQLWHRRRCWAEGSFRELDRVKDEKTRLALEHCLKSSPSERPVNAKTVLQGLDR